MFVLVHDNTAGNDQVSIDSFKKYFLPRVKIENYSIKVDGKNFMISQLMTQLSNMMKSEKYQQDKVMIIRLIIYWISLILKKSCWLIEADLSKKKALDADSISQALIDMNISHEEFITILKEKDKYENMKDNLRNENEKSHKIMRLSSVKSKTWKIKIKKKIKKKTVLV